MAPIRRFLQTLFEKPPAKLESAKTSDDYRRDLEREKLRPVNRSGG